MIGIDEHARLYYEGSSGGAIPLWPSPPFFTAATIVRSDKDRLLIPGEINLSRATLLFREDYFDPVTRIRRGRFYNAGDGARQQEWVVPPHPALPLEASGAVYRGQLRKSLLVYFDWPASHHLQPLQGIVVVLGTVSAMTQWRVISMERISSNEDLVTLKSRSNIGVLPELADDKLPTAHKQRINQFVANVVDTAYRGGAESVIDRCCDMASAVLSAYYDAPEKPLGHLATIARDQNKRIVGNAASILAQLHARGKPQEQQIRRVRHPQDEDAALALECAGTILREIEWTI